MNKERRLSIEIHAIQNFTTNNLNRDDVGSPKDCIFGEARRARISSQAWKRAIRTNPIFNETVREAGGDVGVRTKKIKGEIIKQLMMRAEVTEIEADTLSDLSITEILGVKIKKGQNTEYLLYIGELDISELVGKLAENKEVLLAGSDDPHYKAFVKDLKKIFSGGGKAYAADIALFGRMFANDKSMNVDAACQVAHSISSHKVAMDIDYFTAVDDLNSDSESGAGMIGYTEMNGSCHYRYANINVPLLFSNLGFDSDLTSATIRGFVESFIGSIPTGKQNSMAAHNPPYAVSVIIRDDGKLWNLAGAFSNPVVITPEKSVEEISNEKMKEYWEGLKKAYGVPESIIQTGFTISHDGGSLLNTLEVVQNSIESMISEWNN